MVDVLKLPFRFDPVRLKHELDRLDTSGWIRHYNTRDYEGDWTVYPLRSVGGESNHIYADPTAKADRYAPTPALSGCPYFHQVIDTFECPKLSVRLLRLGIGSRIREHRDYCLGFDDGEIRIHVPVVTSPEVEFYVDSERIVMREGESWYINFNLPHRLYNGGAVDRVHLVIDCVVNDWIRSLFASESCSATLK